MKIPRSWGIFATALTVVFLVAGILVPLANVLFQARSVQGDFSALGGIAALTLQQALWSTVISALGILLGWMLGTRLRDQSRVARIVSGFFSVTFSIPTVVAASAWVAWLGRSGILGRLGLDWAYSLKAVILAHVFFNLPWVALRVAQARAEIHPLIEESAATLGAGRASIFRWIVWPQIRWASLQVLLQVFQLCLTSFSIVLILGGGPPVQTLETEIYSRIRYSGLDLSGAAVCALVQMSLTLPLAFAAAFLEKRWRAPHAFLNVRNTQGSKKLGADGILLGFAILFVLPYLILLGSLSDVFNMEIWSEIQVPLRISLELAGASAVLTIAVALLILTSQRFLGGVSSIVLNFLSGLPASMSVLVLSLGFWIAYQKWVDPFEGSAFAMIAMQSVVFLPLAFRYLKPLEGGIRIKELEIAATLGAGPLRMGWIVEWPRWKKPIFSVLAMVCAASLGEMAAVSLFYSENLITLPVLVMRWMAQYRFGEAQTLSLVLMLIAAGISFVGTRWNH